MENFFCLVVIVLLITIATRRKTNAARGMVHTPMPALPAQDGHACDALPVVQRGVTGRAAHLRVNAAEAARGSACTVLIRAIAGLAPALMDGVSER
jgi:hypothetical protein